MIINRTSFQPTNEAPKAEGDILGTVEVTLNGETRRVPAVSVPKYGWIIARGMIGRYHTASKVWPANVLSQVRADGSIAERANFGRDDNHPKFRKENCLWFA
jgi:hypothetical protein